MKKQTPWYVYMLRCSDRSLYTGITTNINRRVQEHNDDVLGAKYTRAKRPVVLVYAENVTTRSLASKREAEIKHLSKQQKELLVQTFNLHPNTTKK